MAENAPEILVIDDDEVVLVAIADLLEAARFKVSCHSSPAGAADFAASIPSLQAVVLDLNMPIMRGDNVARMFLSRANLRDLPIVLLSGDTPEALRAVHTKMPNVRIVAKSEMRARLVSVIQEAIAERAQRTERRAWGSDPELAAGSEQHGKRQTRFAAKLAAELPSIDELWREIHAGRPQAAAKLTLTLRALHEDADRQALFQIGQLLRAMEQVTLALQKGAKLRPSSETGMQRAMEALLVVANQPGAVTKLTTDAVTDALRRASQELRATHERL